MGQAEMSHRVCQQYLRAVEERPPGVRPITRLYISDFHLRDRDAWSQDVLLRAMCEAVSRSACNHAADSSGERGRPPR